MCTVLQNQNIFALYYLSDLKLMQFFSQVKIYLSSNTFQDAESTKTNKL